MPVSTNSAAWHAACTSLSGKAAKGEPHEKAGSPRKGEEGQGKSERGRRDPLGRQEDGTRGFPAARGRRGRGGSRHGAPESRRGPDESRTRHQEVARLRRAG